MCLFTYDLFMERAHWENTREEKEQVFWIKWDEMTFIVVVVVSGNHQYHRPIAKSVCVYGKCQKRFYVMWKVMKIGFASMSVEQQ